MKILILADEIRAAKSLELHIKRVKADVEIVGSLQTIKAAIAFLLEQPPPDLIFMDVQLGDGPCFEIFNEVIINVPIIFCTAYDENAIEGFKKHGIDYIVKPVLTDALAAIFNKVKIPHHFFTQENKALVSNWNSDNGKKNFLVFKSSKFTTIPVENIAFFYLKHDQPILFTFDRQEFQLNQSLDQVSEEVSAGKFFRINRQYLINFDAIKEVEHGFACKLLVHLNTDIPEKIIIGKNKTTEFLNWLNHR